MTPNVDPQFLRTLLAANAIWATVTLSLTGLGAVAAFIWRRRVLKRQAAERAEICYHCRHCRVHLRGRGHTHVITNELCAACAHGPGIFEAPLPPEPPEAPPPPSA